MSLYVAYGSNLNVQQMSYRCPGAQDLMQPSKGKKEVEFLLLFGISIAKMRRLLICMRDIRDFIKREMYLYN